MHLLFSKSKVHWITKVSTKICNYQLSIYWTSLEMKLQFLREFQIIWFDDILHVLQTKSSSASCGRKIDMMKITELMDGFLKMFLLPGNAIVSKQDSHHLRWLPNPCHLELMVWYATIGGTLFLRYFWYCWSQPVITMVKMPVDHYFLWVCYGNQAWQ